MEIDVLGIAEELSPCEIRASTHFGYVLPVVGGVVLLCIRLAKRLQGFYKLQTKGRGCLRVVRAEELLAEIIGR